MTVKKIIVYYIKGTLAKYLVQTVEELMTVRSCFVFPMRCGVRFLNVKFVVVCFQGWPLRDNCSLTLLARNEQTSIKNV